MMKRVGEKTIFKTKIFTIKDIQLQLDNGKIEIRQILEKKDNTIIVPFVSAKNVLLIKEYFTAIDEYQFDFPGGRIDEDENEYTNANKELQEETGYKSNKLVKLGVFTMSPGYLTQKAHIFLAQDLEESKLQGDESEELDVVSYPFDKLDELIDQGKITEARAIAAIFLVQRYLRNQV